MRWLASWFVLATALAASADAEPDGTTATYEFTFDATWSAETHPTGFPSNPHFSRLGGGTHNEGVSFWDVGQLASPGVESVAERGARDPFLAEVDVAITEGTARSRIEFGNISPSPGSITHTFPIRSTHSRATIISMIAPSPDWFVGVSGLDLREDGMWQDLIVVDLDPYDAGTEEGTTFSGDNPATDPPEPIFQISESPFDGTPPLGTFTFELLSVSPPQIGDMNTDDLVDFDDVAGFVLGLTDAASYEAMYGLLPVFHGDTDGNGWFDFDDVRGFIALLGGASSDGTAKAVPEPSTWMLFGGIALSYLAAGRFRRRGTNR